MKKASNERIRISMVIKRNLFSLVYLSFQQEEKCSLFNGFRNFQLVVRELAFKLIDRV